MSDKTVLYRVRDGVAIVALNAPPANVLDAALRSALWDVFGRIADREDIRAVALVSEHETFSAGADVRDVHAPEAAPTLADLCDRIEACAVPVVAGLRGSALAGGAELCLAAHYRLGTSEARIGFPEVTLGLVPGGGATQRLPRLVGLAPALDSLLNPQPATADTAREIGLLDGIVEGDILTLTHAFAADLAGRGGGPRPTRDRNRALDDSRASFAAVADRRAALTTSRLTAPFRIIDCVEAALLLPFDTGVDFEAGRREDSVADPQSQALRHVFLAERRISEDLLERVGRRRRPAHPKGVAVVDRLRKAVQDAAIRQVHDGASEEEVDGALTTLGFPQGPFGGRRMIPGLDGIAERVTGALVAEGTRLLSAGDVARASDIDALCVHGLAYPRWTGGPMQAAQADGLLALSRRLAAWGDADPLWAPSDLLAEAARYAAGWEALPVRA